MSSIISSAEPRKGIFFLIGSGKSMLVARGPRTGAAFATSSMLPIDQSASGPQKLPQNPGSSSSSGRSGLPSCSRTCFNKATD